MRKSMKRKEGSLKTFLIASFTLVADLLLGSAHISTNQQDVSALQNLYTSLNSPSQLSGWNANGMDPCGESWKGVTCVGTSVTEINLANLGLSGNLGYLLAQLTSVHSFDMSSNSLSGSIPYQLPPNLITLNLERNSFSGTNIPYSVSFMVNLTTLKLGHNQLSGDLIDVFSNLRFLSYLDLSFNQIKGQIPSSFSSLKSLATLDLQSNQLSGTLNALESLTSLQYVNVENNQFSGWIPANFQSIPNARYSGNNFSTTPAPPPPPYNPPPSSPSSSSPPTSSNKDSSLRGGAIGGIVIVVLVALVGGFIAFFFFFRKKRNLPDEEMPIPMTTSMKSDPSSPIQGFSNKGEKEPDKNNSLKWNKSQATSATSYSISELQVATNNFGEDNLVGEGALGPVYTAHMPTDKTLAVRIISALSLDSLQNDEDFMEIVKKLSRLRHSNIAELVGYCAENGQRLLIYDCFYNGNLQNVLHGGGDDSIKENLGWNDHVKFALGVARALEYLHEVCLPAIVHKNVKSGNILLDDDLNPHLADCGIAEFIPSLDTKQSDLGYIAPECSTTGSYTTKSDVYSFGVVMLELLTGRRPFDSTQPRSEQSLVRWATPQLNDMDAVDKIVDPLLKRRYPVKALARFADTIALCVQDEPEFRPPMSEVVQSLINLLQRATMSQEHKKGNIINPSL